MDVNEYKIKITDAEKEFVRIKVEDFLEYFERARNELKFCICLFSEDCNSLVISINEMERRLHKILNNLARGNKALLDFFDTHFDLYNDDKGPFFWENKREKLLQEDRKRINILTSLEKFVMENRQEK